MALRWVMARASSRVIVLPRAAENSSSTALMALRTSPPQAALICVRASGSKDSGVSRSRLRSSEARSTACRTSSGSTGLNSKTVQRLKIALKTVK